MFFSSRPGLFSLRRLCAISGVVAIALAGCTQPPPPPPPKIVEVLPEAPKAGNPTDSDRPEFLRLPGMPANVTPVRVGLILPLSNSNAQTRALAQAMQRAAQMALFDAKNPAIMLMVADEGATPNDAGAAATRLLNQGAEILVGPLFGTSVSVVAPLARDRAVPVLAFSTDRNVAGDGTYLLSFMPENEIRRVIAYAAQQGKKDFSALVPQSAYGDLALDTFQKAVTGAGANVGAIQRFSPSAASVIEPATAIARTPGDALFIPQGGVVLRTIAPTLGAGGVDRGKTKVLGTGLWSDASLEREPMLLGGWFAAPEPTASDAFVSKYRQSYGSAPPQLATLSYDALSLVALLSSGVPYKRFTGPALTDPNGFGGVDGIFRFLRDGTSERGLAVLEIAPGGFTVVSPAPKSFQSPGS